MNYGFTVILIVLFILLALFMQPPYTVIQTHKEQSEKLVKDREKH